MKRIHIFLTILIFSFLLVSCEQQNSVSSLDNTNIAEAKVVEVQEPDVLSASEASDNIMFSETKEVLITVPDNVSEVIISPRALKDMTFKYTDAAKIDAIVSYIGDLGILSKSGSSNPEIFAGSSGSRMDYEIILNTSDGNTEVYYLLGGGAFKQGMEGAWGELTYVTVESFRHILHENEPDVPAKIPLFWDVPITIPENVTMVEVHASGCVSAETYQYTKPEKVNAFVSYISDLSTLQNTDVQNTSISGGMSYIITFHSADGTSEAYYDNGIYFKQGKYGQWCDVKLGHTNRLEELLKQYESDVTETAPKEELE